MSASVEQVVDALDFGDGDTLVVDLDLFVGLEVIPHQHLVAAADQRVPHLDRRQPVDVEMRDHVAGEIDGDERHVGEVVQVAAAGRDHRIRFLDDQVIHDRQVVRGQVPQDADVVLKQPEVDARGIVVIERAESAVVDEVADLPDSSAEQERVVDHDLQVLPVRQLDQLLGLLRRRRERLLDEDVLAVFQRGLGQLEMRPHRGDDRHRVDVGRPQHL